MQLVDLIKRKAAIPALEQLNDLKTHLENLKKATDDLVAKQRGDYARHKTLTEKLQTKIINVHEERERLEKNPEYEILTKSKQDLEDKIHNLQKDKDVRNQTKIPDTKVQLEIIEKKIKEKEGELNFRKEQESKTLKNIIELEATHNNLASEYVLLRLEYNFVETFIHSVSKILNYWSRVTEKLKSQAECLSAAKNIHDFMLYTQLYQTPELNALVTELKNNKNEADQVKHLGEISCLEASGFHDMGDVYTENAPISICLGTPRSPASRELKTPSALRPVTPFDPPIFTNTPRLTPQPEPLRPLSRSSGSTTSPFSARVQKKLPNEDRRKRRDSDDRSERQDSRGSGPSTH